MTKKNLLLKNTQTSFFQEPNSRPTQHPEPQVRQVPMGRDSGRPPSLPAVPRHPYDPVGDDSSPNNTDDSPPPSSKPPGWKQKKFGAFNYFGNLGQPKSTDFSRSSHGQKEASRLVQNSDDYVVILVTLNFVLSYLNGSTMNEEYYKLSTEPSK